VVAAFLSTEFRQESTTPGLHIGGIACTFNNGRWHPMNGRVGMGLGGESKTLCSGAGSYAGAAAFLNVL